MHSGAKMIYQLVVSRPYAWAKRNFQPYGRIGFEAGTYSATFAMLGCDRTPALGMVWGGL